MFPSFYYIGELTINFECFLRFITLVSIVLPTIFAASVFTFQVFSSNSLTLKVRKNQFIIQVTKFERFYCLGQKVAD